MICTQCPRNCKAERGADRPGGVCAMPEMPVVARAALHAWEEPPISGTRGSGAVFFSGCPLGCCFCQNDAISRGNFGAEVTVSRLAKIFLELQDQGAWNINLVSAAQYLPQVIEALDLAGKRLTIPVVYNSGGYEKPESLRLLEGYVDIYLPDLKFYDPVLAESCAGAPDYFAVASAAIPEMFRQTGPLDQDQSGMLRRGVMVRHLVLPGQRKDSERLLRWLAGALPVGEIYLSLMSQYTPWGGLSAHPELDRRLRPGEIRAAQAYMENLGLSGFTQERASAREEYTPPFDLTGI